MRRILLAASRKKEEELLSEWLGNRRDVRTISNRKGILSETYDICIVDRKTYFENRSFVEKCKESGPNSSPRVIVVIRRSRIGEIERDIGLLIDDLLYTPLDKTEFDLRLACQLRLKNDLQPCEKKGEEPDAGSEKNERAVFRRLKILAVDDYILNHKIIEFQLKDHDLTIVDRGAEAVKRLRTQNFDLVLMDIQMPEMDGYQTAKAIRDPSSGVLNRDVPIIALSAHDKDSELQLSSDSGMDGFVKKPIQKATLSAQIEKILARKNNASPVAASKKTDLKKAGRKNEEDEHQSGLYGGLRRAPDETPAPMRCLMDLKATFELMGGKENIVKKVCDTLISDLPNKIESLRHSVASGDFAETRRISHDLKSGARCVCAEEAAELSHELEKVSTAGDKERIVETLPLVEKVFKALYLELVDYRNA